MLVKAPPISVCGILGLRQQAKSLIRRSFRGLHQISIRKRRRQLHHPSVMWITFAVFRIYPVMEREKYGALARDHTLLDPFSPLHHQWTA